jgi:hypothetical protein
LLVENQLEKQVLVLLDLLQGQLQVLLVVL